VSASGDAWVRHRTGCERCRDWHGATPGARLCRVGEKMEAQMRREADHR
jgi:hypothetical protein